MVVQKQSFFVLFVLFSLAIAVPTQWTTNNHYYDVVTISATSNSDMLTKIAALPTTGVLAGYTPTWGSFQTVEEYNFVKTKLMTGTTGYISVGVGRGPSNYLWSYISGPEKGLLSYDSFHDICPGYCNYEFSQPEPQDESNVAIYLATNKFHSVSITTTTSVFIEYVPTNEPAIEPASTAGSLVIVNMNNYFSNLAKIQFTITPPGATAPITLSFTTVNSSTAMVNVPAGSGISTFVITDTIKTYTNTNYKYKNPFGSVVYQPTSGNLLTITGENFGNSVLALSVSLSTSNDICTNIKILQPHTAISCTMPFVPSSSKKLLPLTLQVNNQQTTSVIVGIYDNDNVRVVRLNPSPASYYQYYLLSEEITRTIDGYVRYFGQPGSQKQLDLLKNTQVFSGTGLQSRFSVAIVSSKLLSYWGPLSDSVVVAGNGVCDLSKGLYCPSGSLGVSAAKYVYYDFSSSYQTATGFEVLYGMWINYGVDPTISDISPKLLNTSGGSFNLNMPSGAGFQYSNRQLAINNVNVTASFALYNFTTLTVTAPAGTGIAKDSNLYIDKFKLSNFKVGYYPPYISSVTNKPSTNGDTIIINGVNLGNNANVVTVTVGGNPCNNVAISTAHFAISCKIDAGVGTGLQVYVYVDSQKSNLLTLDYAPPTISNIVQTGNQLTVMGTNFGVMASNIKVNTPVNIDVNANPTAGISQNVTINLPFDTRNGLFYVTVGGQKSSGYQFNLIPSITSVGPLASSLGGTQMVILGSFLQSTRQDNSNANVTVVFGSGECTGAYSQASTVITLYCAAPKGTGKNLTAQVYIDNVASNVLTQFSYLPPKISTFMQVGTVATIAGDNFGEDFHVASISFNNKPAVPATSMHLTRDSIIVPIPLDSQNGQIVAFINGQQSDPFNFQLYPDILTASLIPTVGGEMVFTGNFFNPTNFSGSPLTLKVTVENNLCTNPTINQTGTIVCQAPAGTGANVTAEITIDGFMDDFQVSYIAPSIGEVQVSTTNITIPGTNFGPDLSVITVHLQTANGDQSIAANTLSNGVNQIVTINNIPDDTLNGNLFITVDYQNSNSQPYTLIPTVVSSTTSPTAGGQIRISGTHLTAERADGSDTEVSVSVGGKPCSNPVVDQFDTILCEVPAGTGVNNDLSVTIDNSQSNIIPFAYVAPTIASWSQNGVSVTINGANLGSNPSVSGINLGMTHSPVTSANDVSVVAPLPTFAQSGKISVSIDSQTSNELDIVLSPILESITSTSTAGGSITIQGSYLNSQRQNKTGTSVAVQFLGSINEECTAPYFLDHDLMYTYLVCQAPAGSGKNIEVKVTIDGMSDTIGFSYGAPTLINVTVSNKNFVTLNGTNFGNDNTLVKVALNSQNIDTFTLVSSNIITFQAPSSSVNGLVIVTVDERSTNGQYASFYPIISTVTQSATQGSEIIITGTFLNQFSTGGRPTNTIISVDSVNCTGIKWTASNNQQVVCTAPAGTGVGHHVTVSIESLSSNTIFLDYLPPAISSISQNIDDISISGTNFGTSVSKVSISAGYTVKSVIDNLIVATLNSNSKNGQIAVTVDTQISNTSLLQIQPILTNVNSVSPYGGSVTISGRYLNTKNSDNQETTISITIGGLNCQFTNAPVDGSSFACTLGQQSMSSANVNVTIDGKSGSYQYSSLSPVVLSSSQLFYQVGGVITVGGTYFIEPLTVQVEGVACSNPTLISSTSLTCNYNSSVAQPNNTLLTVQVQSGSLQASADIFSYLQDTCEDGCGDGQCINGFCQCNEGVAGSNCDVEYDQRVVPKVDAKSAQFISNITFNAILAGAKEVDASGATIHLWNFNDTAMTWNVINTTENDQYIRTVNQGSFSAPNPIIVEVETTTWKQETIAPFVGQDLVFPLNSFSHKVRISNVTFANPQNSLVVIYKATYPSLIVDDCEESQAEVESLQNSLTKTLKSLTIDTPFGALVASFSNRLIRDHIHYILDIQTVQDNTTFPDSEGESSVSIALNIPNFTDHIIYDPIFVSYSKTDAVHRNCNSSKKNRNWVIPVAVVLSIVGAALLAGLGYFIYKRKKNASMKRMVQMDLH
ncbi:hypothetical protein PPL_10539 [Heterostelium album PN500]|uniref:IPT/TIG domain-containing protein n=1 Tax=Heterostelium pallidum (strain ATCC 26659 / Pp 5 / PN500) TaxID=670386 RepID=D3BRD1_HETP5|nr:hypothetical protein PPL_10539 [Heterostelium album PN500]EFA75963.1 hypothetical protein PPL_10539 [Heterostelium album PN500]|eukprot:XP_020428097.1 hypothetical protein PPL_10539 [Heterostelium album PN500]